MAGDTTQTRGARHSSRVPNVKMENEVETPRPLGLSSRAQTPRTGKGNNRYGNKGTPKCYSCRSAKRKCEFTDPNEPCARCIAKKLSGCRKLMSEEQQLQTTPQDFKQEFLQPHWPVDEPLLPRVLEATGSTRNPLPVLEKLQAELNELTLKHFQELPAPQVQVDPIPQFYHSESYPQSYQQMVDSSSMVPSFQSPFFYEQSPPSYSNSPGPLQNSFSPFTPNNMAYEAAEDVHNLFPRLQTPRTQSLGNSGSDSQSYWNSVDGSSLAQLPKDLTGAIGHPSAFLQMPPVQDTEMMDYASTSM